MKFVSGRIIVIAVVPMILITGFWNWTRDQVRSQSVDTVPHHQGSNEFESSFVEMASLRRVSPAIVAWEEARSQEEDLRTAVSPLGDDECLLVATDGMTVVEQSSVRRSSTSGRHFLDLVAALETLGADTVFSSVLVGAEPVDGIIDSDLGFVGGGDPALVSSTLAFLFVDSPWGYTEIDVLVDALVASGVRRITGDVVGDGSLFVEEQLSPGDLPTWSGLIVDDGRILTSAQNRGIDSSQTAAKTLLDLLRSKGIAVGGSARTGPSGEGSVPLAVVESPPLRVIAQSLLRSNLSSRPWSVAFGNIESLVARHLEGAAFPDGGVSKMTNYLNEEHGTEFSLASGNVEMSCADARVLAQLLAEQHPEYFEDVTVGGVSATGLVIADGADSIVVATTPLGVEVIAMGDLVSLDGAISDVFDVIDRFSDERDPLAFSPEAAIDVR